MRTFAGCVAVLALAFSATAVAQDKKIDGALLIGKWSPKDAKKDSDMILEFQKGGKLVLSGEYKGKMESLEGSYKLDGDKLDVSLKYGGDEKKESLKVKKLTDAELETEDGMGKSDVFTRVKDAKKAEEKKPADKKAEEKKPADKKAEEKKPEEKKKVEEKKPADKKPADKKPVDEKKKP